MNWECIEGPVDAREGIAAGEGQGNFYGDIYRFRVRNVKDGTTKAIWVRLQGTLTASNLEGETDRHKNVVRSQGKTEIDQRLGDETIPRCISFYAGGAEPVEDDECDHPLSEAPGRSAHG